MTTTRSGHWLGCPALILLLLGTTSACSDESENGGAGGMSGTAGAAGSGAVGGSGGSGGSGGTGGSGAAPAFAEAKILIEHNGVDEDTGFQMFVDGGPWSELSLAGPGAVLLEVTAQGELAGFGLTEMFFETNEPPNATVPIADVLTVLPEGEYTFTGVDIDSGEMLASKATLTHDIPNPPPVTQPADGALVDPDADLVVSWDAVTQTLDGKNVSIVAYQLIVVRDLDLPPAQGFSTEELSATVLPSVTSVTVPHEFLTPGTPYQIEVLALEESGNQTIGGISFETSGTGPSYPPRTPDPTKFEEGRFLIEHNAADEDTGYQMFLDHDPWKNVTLTGPASAGLLGVAAKGSLEAFGLTEMFLETREPPNASFPIADVLALFPAGAYTYSGADVAGTSLTRDTTLAHAIPAKPTITLPMEGASVDATQDLVVSWDPVTEDLEGNAVTVVGYQLIATNESPGFDGLPGFSHRIYSVHVPETTTSLRIPKEFLEPGTPYEIELLALEATGNQTIALVSFDTM